MESIDWVQKQFTNGNKLSIYSIGVKTGLDKIICLSHSGENAIAGPIYGCAVMLDGNFRTKDLKPAKEFTKSECHKLAESLKRKRGVYWSLGIIAACHAVHYGVKEAIKASYIAALANMNYLDKFDMIISEPFTLDIIPNRIKTVPRIMAPKIEELCDGVMVANVLAKYCRDAFMVSLDYKYPGFNWASNSGYASPQHLEGIKSYGVTPEHHNLDNVKTLKGTQFKQYGAYNG